MDAAITAVPPEHRRLMITCDGTGASGQRMNSAPG
jgi:hypothetical protein